MKVKPKTINWLARIYAVANTPSYLYRHFRKEESVKELATQYSPKELMSYIIKIDRKDTPKIDETVCAYAACTALTFHDLTSVIEIMNKVKLRNLEWVEQIINLWKDLYVPVQIIKTHYIHEPNINNKEIYRSDVKTKRINISYRPETKIVEKGLFKSDSSSTEIKHGEEKDD